MKIFVIKMPKFIGNFLKRMIGIKDTDYDT
jgi:hypothetical protein